MERIAVAASSPSAVTPERSALARQILARLYPQQAPASTSTQTCVRDLCQHLAVLERAMRDDNDDLFCEYAAWSGLVLAATDPALPAMATVLTATAEVLAAHFDPRQAARAGRLLAAAINRLKGPSLVDIDGLEAALRGSTEPAAHLLDSSRARLAALGLAIHYMRKPEQALAHGSAGRRRCYDDVLKHTAMLARAIQRGDFALFGEYCRWATQLYLWLGIERAELGALLEAAATAADLCLADNLADVAAESLLEAARVAREDTVTPPAILALPSRRVMTQSYGDRTRGLRPACDDLARLTLLLYYMRHPHVALAHGERGRASCLTDTIHHFHHLADAELAGSERIFADYLSWVGSVLREAKIARAALHDLLECMYEAIRLTLPATVAASSVAFAQRAVSTLERVERFVQGSYIDETTTLGRLARAYHDQLLAGERHNAAQLVMQAVASGIQVQDIYLGVFQTSQYEIGRLWQHNEISVAQEHFCTAATQMIMSQLYPHVFRQERCGRRLVATCVTQDMHEIGIRMVCDFYEMAGWDTFYLGANTPLTDIVSALVQHRADVLAVSATISTHIGFVRDLIAAVRAHPTSRHTPVIVGGLPFLVDQDLWRNVGASGYSRNAQEAVELGQNLTQ